MTPIADWQGKYPRYRCPECGAVHELRAQPAAPPACDHRRPQPPARPAPAAAAAIATPQQIARRQEICRGCTDFDPAPPGCRFDRECSRRLIWESRLRLGTCPRNLWQALTPDP